MIRGAFLSVESNDAECAGLKTPTFVLAGAHDAQWLDASRRLRALINGSQFLEVAGAGHLAHLEQPGLVGDAIHGFIERHR